MGNPRKEDHVNADGDSYLFLQKTNTWAFLGIKRNLQDDNRNIGTNRRETCGI